MSFLWNTRVRSCFPFWLSPPCRNISSAASTAPAELPPSLSPSSLSSPLLLLPYEQVTKRKSKSSQRAVNIPLFSLADNQVVKLSNRILPEEISDAHCVGSSHGWLAFVNGRNCGFYLVNLFSPSVSPEIIQLPTIETLPGIKSVVRDSTSNKVKKYKFHACSVSPDTLGQFPIQRFAMSSAPNNGDNNCTVMISIGDGYQPVFCRIGDISWTLMEKNRFDGHKEIMYSNKHQLFYTVTPLGHLEAWDFRDSTSPKRIPFEVRNKYTSSYLSTYESDLRSICRTEWDLVELSGGDILAVIRYFAFVAEDGTYVSNFLNKNPQLPYRTARFDIVKVGFGKKNAEHLTSIGDNALFLGDNHAFSLSTRDYPHLKPNSIYFTEKFRDTVISEFIFDKHYPYRDRDVGVYSFEDYSVTPLYHPLEFKKILPPPIWVFPGKY